MNLLPLYLLLLLLPLAVAGQNIGSGVVAVILFVRLYQKRAELPLAEAWRRFRWPFLASVVYLVGMMLSTMANPGNPARFNGAFIFGHLIWALLPATVFLALPPLTKDDWRKLGNWFAFVAVVMGLVTLSQAFFGWKLSGSHFEAAGPRAQGFYSHPLTLAYVALVLFPLGCVMVARQPKKLVGWLTAGGFFVAIATSQSRTVELVALAVILFNALFMVKSRVRWLAAAVLCVGMLGTYFTNNPVSRRFHETLEHHDVRSDYADDRLAFWEANFNMWRERPVLGHGDGLDTEYRHRFYKEIGLGTFDRQYEAHNMYLQVAVNGGLLALASFLFWFGWYFRRSAWLGRRGSFGGIASLETLSAFCVAAITQNAFQDSEVRYALTLLTVALWLLRDDEPEIG